MRLARVLLLCAWVGGWLSAQNMPPLEAQRLGRSIFQELIEINTTDSVGSTTTAANAIAARLKAAGIPDSDIRLLEPVAKRGNLVARLHGTGGAKPLMLLAHLDVVEARASDWSVPPFQFLERDGYFYGRGTSDDKSMAAIWTATLLRLKQEGFQPKRDIILALTAGEESGKSNGVEWLVRERKDLIDSALCLNEGGDGAMKNGKRLFNGVQAAEKVYVSFALEVHNRGGHSSQPRKDNAIYQLSRGLLRFSEFEFPVHLNEVTRTFFARSAATVEGQLAADMKAVSETPENGIAPPDVVRRLAESPYLNALLRTTCVATQMEAGHAENALPQTARAVVNCRMLPDDNAGAIAEMIRQILNDREISVSQLEPPKPSPPSPLTPEVFGVIERVTESMWAGVPAVPLMGTGATDGLFLRRAGIPTYGVSGIFGDVDDNREHGRDERIGVRDFYEGQEFLYRLVKLLAR